MDKRLSLKSIVRREADPDYFHLYAAQGDLIVDPVVDTDTVCVANPIDLLAIIGRDLGIAPGSIRVEGSTMLLKRSEEHEAMLLEMKRERRGRSSTPTCDGFTTEDIAHCFGLTETDLEKTTSWMRLQGLESLSVSADRTSIRFSGDLLAVEIDGVVEAGVEDGRWVAGILGRAEDGDGVGGLSLILPGDGVDLVVDPAEPEGGDQ